MVRFSTYLLFVLYTVGTVGYHFQDNDLTCGPKEHLNGFVRTINQQKHDIQYRCSRFAPNLKQDATCTIGKAMKCDGTDEGCDDPEAWIGGLQAFDTGSLSEVYRPYCCKSGQVSIRHDKCRDIDIPSGDGGTAKYFFPPARVLYRWNCQYVQGADGKISDMQFSAKDCLYHVGPPVQHGKGVGGGLVSSVLNLGKQKAPGGTAG